MTIMFQSVETAHGASFLKLPLILMINLFVLSKSNLSLEFDMIKHLHFVMISDTISISDYTNLLD